MIQCIKTNETKVFLDISFEYIFHELPVVPRVSQVVCWMIMPHDFNEQKNA